MNEICHTPQAGSVKIIGEKTWILIKKKEIYKGEAQYIDDWIKTENDNLRESEIIKCSHVGERTKKIIECLNGLVEYGIIDEDEEGHLPFYHIHRDDVFEIIDLLNQLKLEEQYK